MKIRHFIMAVGMVLTSFLPCSATDIFFQTIDAKDGLADNFVRDITRDTYGYIWLSTINGISRYDGYRLTNYMPLQYGGSGNDVSMVRETADTTLWMVSVRDLYTYDRKNNTWQKDGAARLAKFGVEGTMKLFYVDNNTDARQIKPSEITISSLDEELISHVIANIEANLQDVNYSVTQLSSDVGMTRGHLYKKLMAITGKSPLEFIRIVKLKRGKSLLDQGRTNISEVYDMVGLSAKQFTHYFKLIYNHTPSEYLKKNHH